MPSLTGAPPAIRRTASRPMLSSFAVFVNPLIATNAFTDSVTVWSAIACCMTKVWQSKTPKLPQKTGEFSEPFLQHFATVERQKARP